MYTCLLVYVEYLPQSMKTSIIYHTYKNWYKYLQVVPCLNRLGYLCRTFTSLVTVCSVSPPLENHLSFVSKFIVAYTPLLPRLVCIFFLKFVVMYLTFMFNLNLNPLVLTYWYSFISSPVPLNTNISLLNSEPVQ